METTTLKKKKPVLLSENEMAIKSSRDTLANLTNLLNSINRTYTLKTPHEVPDSNTDRLILEMALAGDEFLREMHKRKPIYKTDEITLPERLMQLKIDLEQWKNIRDKHLIDYIAKTKNGFAIDNEKLEQHFNTKYRVFAETPEQLNRLSMCKKYLEWIDELKPDPMNLVKLRCFLVIWNPYQHNFIPNHKFILNGEI